LVLPARFGIARIISFGSHVFVDVPEILPGASARA
jgi:hypothetical protein